MARNSGPQNSEDEYASPRGGVRADLESSPADPFGDGEPDSARLLDLEPEEQSPFLRAQKRVPVRRGPLPKKAASRLKAVLVLAALGGFLAVMGFGLNRYVRSSWRFRLESSDLISVTGNHNVSLAQILEVFGADISRNVFSVPLDERKKQLEQVPWIQSAAVMRLWPNRIAVSVRERTPIAFARVGSRILLVDGNGVLMELPGSSNPIAPNGAMGTPQAHYSFPVIEGMGESDPLSSRAARMKIYQALLRELDGGGAHYSQDLNDVDLSDPDDVKVTVADPNGVIVVHLGSSNFLDRYKIYVSHVQEWRQQYSKLDSVDLRYDRQVILNPDSLPAADPSVATQSAEKAGAEAGNASKTSSGVSSAGPARGSSAAKNAKAAAVAVKKKRKSEKANNGKHLASSGRAIRAWADENKRESKKQSAVEGAAVNSAPKPAVVAPPKPAGNGVPKPVASSEPKAQAE